MCKKLFILYLSHKYNLCQSILQCNNGCFTLIFFKFSKIDFLKREHLQQIFSRNTMTDDKIYYYITAIRDVNLYKDFIRCTTDA
jgi:hypothetical protein